MDRESAELEARQHVGSVLFAKEGMREAHILGWMESVWQDLRHGVRLFARQPFLAFLAVLTLLLGVGANTALFSFLNAPMFKSLPFAGPDQLVAIVDGFGRTGRVLGPTIPELIDVRGWTRDLEVTFYDTRDYQIMGGSEPLRVFAARIDASLFKVLGILPA